MHSEQINELAAALATAQKAMKAPTKRRVGKVSGTSKSGKAYEYEYNYADLADVIECARGALADNGLALTQVLRMHAEGFLVMETLLMHTSGQWLSSEVPIPNGLKPQELGSFLTYMRRYAGSSILGIAAEDDDDGARAQRAKRNREPQEEARHAETGESPAGEPPAPEAPMPADASAILDLAAEVQQLMGGTIEGIVKGASGFIKDGRERYFTDPRDNVGPKWLAATRRRLEGDLAKYRTAHEPGAAEAASKLS